jgi:hypothetical protein
MKKMIDVIGVRGNLSILPDIFVLDSLRNEKMRNKLDVFENLGMLIFSVFSKAKNGEKFNIFSQHCGSMFI